jgi:predicted DsbA family dithiol-disulfide isomerase
MRAYFFDHRTISEPTVLADVAASCGLDRDSFRTELIRRGAELQRAVLDEHDRATDGGVYAVPSIVVNGFALPGAQDVATYRRLVDRLLARTAADGA